MICENNILTALRVIYPEIDTTNSVEIHDDCVLIAPVHEYGKQTDILSAIFPEPLYGHSSYSGGNWCISFRISEDVLVAISSYSEIKI